MSGFIGSLIDLAEGDPAQTQENQLSALGGYETGIGETGTTAALNYDLGLLSGDPTKMAQTLAPEISAGQQQAGQQQKTLAEFAPRSGGTAAQSNAAQTGERANIINLEGGLQQGAAGQAGGLGASDLGMATNNINDVATMKTARRASTISDWNEIAKAAAEIATMNPEKGDVGGTPGAGNAQSAED
jgi:hypothetical protein